jgi:hypothetical protein
MRPQARGYAAPRARKREARDKSPVGELPKIHKSVTLCDVAVTICVIVETYETGFTCCIA